MSLCIVFLPWKLKRWFLIKIWKYEIHPTAKIGFSWVFPEKLIMEKYSKIDHLNVAVHLGSIVLGDYSKVGRSNWITGFPASIESKHFSHQKYRKSELIIGKHSAVTKNHHIDCTNTIRIGDFVTVAGYNSQFLTHSIDIYEGRQDSKPILIGDYCFISTGVKILGGAALPDFSVLAAGAVLNKSFSDGWIIYGGVPAKPIKDIDKSSKYFSREKGFVN